MYRRITASCIILFMLVSGFRNEEVERTGLLGKSITLPSGVTEPGNITNIEWSVFTNETYIAGFSGGKLNIPDIQRMKLNIITGDLKIMNLRKEDSGTYTVRVRNREGGRWNNKVILSVQEGLPVPKITVTNSTVQHGMCKIFLTCSVKNESTVNITYGPEGFPHGCKFNHLRNVPMGREAEAWCSPIQDVNVTCTASDRVRTAASTVTTGCSVKGNISEPAKGVSSHDSTKPGEIIMIIIIILLLIIIIILVMYRKPDVLPEFARTPWTGLTECLPFLAQRSKDEGKDSNYVNTVQFEQKPGQDSTDPEPQRLQIPGKDSNHVNTIQFEEEPGQDSTDPEPQRLQIPGKDLNYVNTIQFEEELGQVSTDPEPQRLQIPDEVTIKDNMALPEEESSKKKEYLDDTKPKETAEEQCGQTP